NATSSRRKPDDHDADDGAARTAAAAGANSPAYAGQYGEPDDHGERQPGAVPEPLCTAHGCAGSPPAGRDRRSRTARPGRPAELVRPPVAAGHGAAEFRHGEPDDLEPACGAPHGPHGPGAA